MVNGSKNGGLPLLSAALLTNKNAVLRNIPVITDISRSVDLMRQVGAVVDFTDHTITLTNGNLNSSELDIDIAKQMRASIFFTVPVLARTGEVKFPHPGGCVIGERPINLFIEGYTALGAKVTNDNHYYHITATQLSGVEFTFPIISVAGTENMMMLATIAEGVTTLINAAMEPEVVMLADFLNKCGALISGAGTSVITIRGKTKYNPDPIDFTNIPDRLEAGSFVILGNALNSEIEISECDPAHLSTLLAVLRKIGCKIEVGGSSIKTFTHGELTPTSIKTHEYPGFVTDLQSPMAVLLTQARGQSFVHETIFEGRMAWVEDLKHMGAKIINLDNFRIAIDGPTPLHGKVAESLDIRAGMAYLIADLLADGRSIINGIEKIDRGYENIEERLKAIGADIERVS